MSLVIYIPEFEILEGTEFSYHGGFSIELEHSLYSVSKWEAKWHKPFLDTKDMTTSMIRDYIRCMTLTPSVDPYIYYHLSDKDIQQISEYINDPMTATTIREDENKAKRVTGKFTTSEEIYYMMVALQIPFECQYWHLSRLLTLIRVCSIRNAPPKKMSKGANISQRKALNARRRAATGSRG